VTNINGYKCSFNAVKVDWSELGRGRGLRSSKKGGRKERLSPPCICQLDVRGRNERKDTTK